MRRLHHHHLIVSTREYEDDHGAVQAQRPGEDIRTGEEMVEIKNQSFERSQKQVSEEEHDNEEFDEEEGLEGMDIRVDDAEILL